MSCVLLTGANRGLGLEMTRQYLARGWEVIVLTRSVTPELEILDSEGSLEIHQITLTDDEALARVAAMLTGRTIDVLINNAGTMGYSSFAEEGFEIQQFGSFNRQEWHDVFDINVFTPMRISELFLDNVAAADNGRIVTISSMLGSMGLNTMGGLYLYRASKAAVNSIMTSMGVDLGKGGVIAAALHPGWVQTDMGGSEADIDAQTSVSGLLQVIDNLSPAQAGKLIAYDGSEMPF
ncbi:MAG: SDR family oxidoreductase [Xanthomonadales bacterium]|nr:SDR family oxidoreductase [Xanthomonadales bacterium]